MNARRRVHSSKTIIGMTNFVVNNVDHTADMLVKTINVLFVIVCILIMVPHIPRKEVTSRICIDQKYHLSSNNF